VYAYPRVSAGFQYTINCPLETPGTSDPLAISPARFASSVGESL